MKATIALFFALVLSLGFNAFAKASISNELETARQIYAQLKLQIEEAERSGAQVSQKKRDRLEKLAENVASREESERIPNEERVIKKVGPSAGASKFGDYGNPNGSTREKNFANGYGRYPDPPEPLQNPAPNEYRRFATVKRHGSAPGEGVSQIHRFGDNGQVFVRNKRQAGEWLHYSELELSQKTDGVLTTDDEVNSAHEKKTRIFAFFKDGTIVTVTNRYGHGEWAEIEYANILKPGEYSLYISPFGRLKGFVKGLVTKPSKSTAASCRAFGN